MMTWTTWLLNMASEWQSALDLALKSLIVLLAAGMAAWALRSAAAALRHWVWSAALVSVLALPLLTMVLPGWRVASWPAISSATAWAEMPETENWQLPAPIVATGTQPVSPVNPVNIERLTMETKTGAPSAPFAFWLWAANRVSVIDWKRVALLVWLSGCLAVLARMVFGTARVWWIARRAKQVNESNWLDLLGCLAVSLRLPRRVRLLTSAQVELPMTWGAWRAVVLLPLEAEAWPPERRNVVLLHELAHVKRRDCLTQMLAQLACAFYWFNPLVWYAARQLRIERELACDDHVLEVGTRASDYAAHLVEIAGAFGTPRQVSPVAVGMACSQLESRVRAILAADARPRQLNLASAGLVGLATLCLLVPLAMARPSNSAQAVSSLKQQALEPEAFSVYGQADAQRVSLGDLLLPPTQASRLTQGPEPVVRPSSDAEAESEAGSDAEADAKADAAADAQSASQSANAQAGQGTELTAEQIIQLRRYDVTPEYIEAMRKLFDNLSIRDLVNLRAQNVTEDFIRQARQWGNGQLSVKELVQLKIAGVTGEYLNLMKQAGFENLTIGQLSNLRLHNVTPEYVAILRRGGFDKLSPTQVTQMRIHDINEEFIRQARNWGSGQLSPNELVQLKIAGVTGAYLNSMKQAGFENLTLGQLSNMRLQDVTPEYVAMLRRNGYDKLSANQVTQLRTHNVTEEFINGTQNWTGGRPAINDLLQVRIHDVTPEFANRMKALGFDNLTLNTLTQMRIHGVDEAFVKEMRAAGFDKLTVEQLLQMRIHGVTPEYVKKMRAAGLKNVSVNDALRMRISGVDEILLKRDR